MLGKWVVGVGALGAVALTGCAASGVHFAGSRQPAVVAMEGVQLGVQPPPELHRLGRVSVECSPPSPGDDVEGVRASDLSCSSEFLQAALREAAAEAGGSFLLKPECRDERTNSGGKPHITWLGCDAEVFGPAPAAQQTPLPPAVSAATFGSVRDAWHISIDFWPAPGSTRPPARDFEGVAEVDFPRVGQLRLGDLSATCAKGCARGSLRRGLRAAAAWLGATTLVDVRCIQKDPATTCSASISSPEREEERAPQAVTSARD